MKKLTKIGILIFAMSLIVIYMSSLAFQSGFQGGSSAELGVRPHGTVYYPVNLTNSTVAAFFYYTNGSDIDYYLLNQSGFEFANSTIMSGLNLSSDSNSLKARGAIDMEFGSSYGSFPYQASNASSLSYQYSQSPILPPGTYYNLFQNPSGGNVTVSLLYVLKSQSSVQGSIISSSGYGIAGAALFFSGVVIMAYSLLFDKEKKQEAQVQEEEIEKVYGSREKHNNGRHHSKKGKRERKRA